MDTKRSTTKSPLALARAALAAARESLPAYSSKYSRHDFTQHQLSALLALRETFHADYRGLEAIVRDWSELRDELGLTKVPDHTTLQKASQRLRGKGQPSLRGHQPKPASYPLFPAEEGATLSTDLAADPAHQQAPLLAAS